jgi:hypothetical protein
MFPLRLAVIGAGSVRHSPAVVAALANYFGERPLEICLFDADEERLELFSRFARVCCTVSRSQHVVFACSDIDEALDAVDLAIVQIDENCARKFLAKLKEAETDDSVEALGDEQAIALAAEMMVPGDLVEAGRVLNLMHAATLPDCRSIADWPLVVPETERYKVPHQVLRWIRGEEHVGEWLAEHDRSPLCAWLDEAIAVIPSR